MRLLSPDRDEPLRRDGPYAVTDGSRRWPLIDGIAYLRSGRKTLTEAVLARLDAGETEEALVLLLADQDDWWTGDSAEVQDLRHLVRERERLSLREAMRLLGWGRVGDYFAHRWTDPTFLAGLALVEAHWTAPRSAFELACGIGHHLRALHGAGVAVAGGDVVFAKLWIARHWVAPDAELVCFDASGYWPLRQRHFDLATCHDAFYFLEPKPVILQRLREISSGGSLLIGHIHNREFPNFSSGAGLDAEELERLVPGALLYDDAELTLSLVEARAPRALPADALRGAEAFCAALGAPSARTVQGRLGAPRPGAMLSRNPLYGPDRRIDWPSERYREEYAARATYPTATWQPAQVTLDAAPAEAVRRRELVELPERW